MWTTKSSNTTDKERYLQRELDDLRAQTERDQERAEREREQRRRERQQEMAYAQRQADTWPEALHKQIGLLSGELSLDDETDHFFGNSIEACRKALEIWLAVETERSPEIAELEARIAAIRDEIRNTVADRLEESNNSHEYALVSDQLRGNDLQSFLDW